MCELVNFSFDLQSYYMFGFNYNGGEPSEVIVARPSFINGDGSLATFHFLYGHHSLSESIKRSDVVAVSDNSGGDFYLTGWSGKYKILNRDLFDRYVLSGAIKVKS